MAAYSLDLRKRVMRAWDQGMGAEAVAATYDVSRALAELRDALPTTAGVTTLWRAIDRLGLTVKKTRTRRRTTASRRRR